MSNLPSPQNMLLYLMIFLVLFGKKCSTVSKNGTSYLTMTGKGKQTTFGILDVITITIVCFFLVFKINFKEFKVSQLVNSTIKLKNSRK